VKFQIRGASTSGDGRLQNIPHGIRTDPVFANTTLEGGLPELQLDSTSFSRPLGTLEKNANEDSDVFRRFWSQLDNRSKISSKTPARHSQDFGGFEGSSILLCLKNIS
jgi:hypothetical protein